VGIYAGCVAISRATHDGRPTTISHTITDDHPTAASADLPGTCSVVMTTGLRYAAATTADGRPV
jgi:hypothetical protein